MARNKVMTLWTAIVTAFLALCTALGLITSTAAAAVPQTESARNSGGDSDSTEQSAVSALSHWAWAAYARSLPPTMKQRIRAEAHGKTPSCRHRSLTDTEADAEASGSETAGSEASGSEASGSEAASEALDCGSTTIPAQAKAPAAPIPLQR